MRLCDVFAVACKAEMYLFVLRVEGLERVPEELLHRLGELRRVTTFELQNDKKLARADINEVRRKIGECGYYLQMPPAAPLFGNASDKSLTLP